MQTVLSIASAARSRGRLVIRGRLTTGASASLLRITLSRRARGRTVRLQARAGGARTGSWRAVVTLPRSVRAVRRWSVTVRYPGESGYTPASVTSSTTVRLR